MSALCNCQAPLAKGFPRPEYWSGLPSPGDLPDPGIEPESPANAGDFFTTESPGKRVLCSTFSQQNPVDRGQHKAGHLPLYFGEQVLYTHMLLIHTRGSSLPSWVDLVT